MKKVVAVPGIVVFKNNDVLILGGREPSFVRTRPLKARSLSIEICDIAFRIFFISSKSVEMEFK